MNTAPVNKAGDDLFPPSSEAPPPQDAFTRSWLAQAILRMRRELSWLWRNREPVDRLAEWLERQSLAEQRLKFFAEDATAHYLDEQVRSGKTPRRSRGSARGTLPWLARELHLSRGEIFVVALALAAARDAALGSLIATLQGDPRNDASRSLPTLGLAQWLWDDPWELAALTSSAHPLFARGILRRLETGNEWTTPIHMPVLIAQILEGRRQHTPLEMERIAGPAEPAGAAQPADSPEPDRDHQIELLASRMAQGPRGLHIVPVAVAFAADTLDSRRAAPALRRIAALTGRPIYSIRPDVVISAATLENAAACCWLYGADLLLPSQGMPQDSNWQSTLRPFPLYVFAAASNDGAASPAPSLPTLHIPAPDYAERREAWQRELSKHKLEADPEAVRECAYRFRLDSTAIAEVATGLSHAPGPLTAERMNAACQQQVGMLLGAQATLVVPRFRRHEMILDAERTAQFDQLLSAMRNVSRVHADWGTGRAWGDSGISALFAGAPGTGKNMAAEVLAAELNLPMYHVDLSQILNKFIGETEKNLRKLFDAAEQSDVVLFFDEAESLFGQRMQARSSNDRFANMDVSYLLERMDRFRGLAILATNRKKDLDEAFLRRLRYVIDFPVPAEAEREAIWKKCIPPQVSSAGIDLAMLAREFALPGGNIRSIVLNACLQAASAQQAPALSMDAVMTAVDREYEKIGRPLTREQKSQWQLGPARMRAIR